MSETKSLFKGCLVTLLSIQSSGSLHTHTHTHTVASSVFQSSTFGFAGVLPMQYTSIVMSGQACAGIFAALVNIIFTAAATDTTDSTLGYFSTAVAVILLCLISFLPLIRLVSFFLFPFCSLANPIYPSPLQRFVQYYLAQTSVKTQKAKQEAGRYCVSSN